MSIVQELNHPKWPRLFAFLVTLGAWTHTYVYQVDFSSNVITSASQSPLHREQNGHLVIAGDSQHWTTSRSPRHNSLPIGTRISFQLRDTGEFGARTDDSCYKNDEDARRFWTRTMELPPTLIDARSAKEWEVQAAKLNGQSSSGTSGGGGKEMEGRGGRILDFSTSIATDLKIMFLGDSVAEQFSKAFEAAATGVPGEIARLEAEEVKKINSTILSHIPDSSRHVIAHFVVGGKPRQCVFVTGPVRGGGVVALWRVVKLFSMSRKNANACNAPAGGWRESHFHEMLQHEYLDPGDDSRNASQSMIRVNWFDAVVLRIQLGWMKPASITREGINETITLCRDYIGANTVVIMTINFTNDVHNPNEWQWAHAMNNNIRELAQMFNEEARATDSKFRVLIMEFSDFTTQVHWANARTILDPTNKTLAYPNLDHPNVSNPDYGLGGNFLFDRFKPWHREDRHPHSIPTVCSRMLDNFVDNNGVERRNCKRNAIMRDGLHWCESSVGPRYHAGLACLLGCVYNRNNVSLEGDLSGCERACNKQFMSLVPLDESWLNAGTTLFSTSAA
mmetsp:Transcript_9894/g.21440  ORF Transcript_9894/g.21440 Transcript_9894/m.21440 type:complete len:563 (+) Transcript_9894:27-1715(+)